MTGPSRFGLGSLRRRLDGIGPAGLVQRAGWASIVEVLQLVSSLLVFFVLAKLLTTDDFGVMGAVLGIALPVASLSSFGSHILLIKRVAQGEHLFEAWQRATAVGILGPAVGSLLIIGLRPLILPSVDAAVYALFILGQVNFFWLSELAVYVGNGTGRLKESAEMRLLVVSCRIAALGAFAVFGDGQLLWWAMASMISFAVGAVISMVYVWRVFGPEPNLGRASTSDFRQGLPFSVNAVSESLVDASDRPLLVRYDHRADAGIYTMGARIIQFGYLPIRTLLRASDADLFAAGKRGTLAALRVTTSLLKPGIAIGLGMAVVFFLFAPLIPIVVGEEYRDVTTMIRLLAFLPLIRAVQYLMGNCLSASDHQWWRVGATLFGAGLNFGLNVMFLPSGTWRTAVYTTLLSELALTSILIWIVLAWAWKETRDESGVGGEGPGGRPGAGAPVVQPTPGDGPGAERRNGGRDPGGAATADERPDRGSQPARHGS